jgi:hypothetical protein
LGNYGDENSKKQHLNLISYLLREFPELRVVLNTHLHRKAGRKFWFFQNIAEFSFLNDIFLKNILVVYPHLSDFQTLLLSILDGKSIFEKLFLEARTPIMRHELLNCYCELLKKNAFAGLATQVHFGEEIPDVVSFVRQRNPLSLEFFQYLDFIYLTYIHHIISSDLLKTILFGRENNTVNYLLSLRSSSLYLMFTNHLFENYQSLSENFQHLIGMREYLLSSKPLLLAMERNDEAIVESLMELYSSYFSVEELLKIIRCYQSIVQIKAQEHLVFDPDEEEQQLVTQIDLGFLVDDDLKHLEETLDIDEPPTSSLSR